MIFKNNPLKFKVKESTNNELIVYKQSSNGTWNNKPFCYINEKEIFFGKGSINIKKVDELIEKKIVNNFIYLVSVKANTTWNDNVKRKNPILWHLRLISRSKDYFYNLGIANTQKDSDILKKFFSKLNISISNS